MLNTKTLLIALKRSSSHTLETFKECIAELIINHPNEDWKTLLNDLSKTTGCDVRGIWCLGNAWSPTTLTNNIRCVARLALEAIEQTPPKKIIEQAMEEQSVKIHLNTHLFLQEVEAATSDKRKETVIHKEVFQSPAGVLAQTLKDLDATPLFCIEACYDINHKQLVECLFNELKVVSTTQPSKQELFTTYFGDK